MTENNDEQLRVEALSQAVRVALATGGDDSDTDTVTRAGSFHDFLTGGN